MDFLLEFAHSPLGMLLIGLLDAGFIFVCVYTILKWNKQDKEKKNKKSVDRSIHK